MVLKAVQLGGEDTGQVGATVSGLQGGYTAMARIVLKFGGTSVGDIDRIKNVARKVKVEVDAGHQVAVVVSAMSGAGRCLNS